MASLGVAGLLGGLWLLETFLACVTYGTLYARDGFTVVESKVHFFKSEGRGKGTKVSHALHWAGSKMYLVSPL